jgi:hypothetical protein
MKPCFQLLRKLAQRILTNPLPDGVTVTQRPLEPLFMVRIHVGQRVDFLLSFYRDYKARAPTTAPETPAAPCSAVYDSPVAPQSHF